MGFNENIAQRIASQLAPLMYADSGLVNIFDNVPNAVVNTYHHDNRQMSRKTTVLNGFDGSTHTWSLDKWFDCTNQLSIRVKTRAPTLNTSPDTVTRFVEQAGYHVCKEMWISMTNNEVTPRQNVVRMKHTRDRLHPQARQYLDHQTSMLLTASPALLNTSLMAGHTFRIPFEWGGSQQALQNYLWVSPLSHELELNVTLANASDIIYAPNGSGTGVGQTGNITNYSSLIESLDMVVETVTVDDTARLQTTAKHNSPGGLYNFLTTVKEYYNVIPLSAGPPADGKVEWQLCGVNVPTRLITLYIESEYNASTPWNRKPLFVNPTFVDPAGTTIAYPTHFEILGGGGEVIIQKREIDLHHEWNSKNVFTGKEAGGLFIDIPMAIKDPTADNSIHGAYDFSVWKNIHINLYYNTAPASGGSGPGARVTAVFFTHNYTHFFKGDAYKSLQ